MAPMSPSATLSGGPTLTTPATPTTAAASAAPAPDAQSAASPARPAPAGRSCRRRHVTMLVAGDGAAIIAALVVSTVPAGEVAVGALPAAAGWLVGCGWLLALGLAGCYRARHWDSGAGAGEYRRIGAATFRLWAGLGLAAYLTGTGPGRGPLLVAPPVGLTLLLAVRALARHRRTRARLRGRMCRRMVLVGHQPSAAATADALRRGPAAGLQVVGVCVPGPVGQPAGGDPPVLGTVEDTLAVVAAARADTVAVTALDLAAGTVRRLCWALEGTGVEVLVAPGVAGVAGTRLSVREVAGLPLLHLELPAFTGARRLIKDSSDRVLAALGLVLLCPLLLAVGAAVRLSSPGPALFRQPRAGRGGAPFQVYKFRTMYADAEERLAGLSDRNEADGLLFKIRQDPRVTPLGRLLRRTSVDELPQLLNVLRGQMSLVGPRPLPVAGGDFTGDERRRLLVRPGITGLWQVSGRSRLSWQDAVRLDLYYVENWSLRLDLSILLRTAGAVVRGVGAY